MTCATFQSVNPNVFIPCLLDLCKSLFKIILSYHQLTRWHSKQETENAEAAQPIDIEENLNREYIRQKLDHNLQKIWQDVQSKVSNLLLNSDLSCYKFDQFLQILGIVHRLIQVGEEFCGSKSDELQESIRKQSVAYFKSYHVQRMDELRIFLENESWEICPVKHTFEILQLQEFKALRYALKEYKSRPQNFNASFSHSPDCNSSTHSQDGSSVIGNYFIRFSERGTPFDSRLDETLIEEDIMADVGEEASGYFSDDSDEEPYELKQDYVDDCSEDENEEK